MRVSPENLLAEQVQLDTMLSGFHLELRRTFYPWGFPFELETNSPDVIEAAAESWGAFPQTFNEAPVRLSLAVTASEAPLLTSRSTFASREHLLSMYGDAENFLMFDFRQGFAFGCVSRGTAADSPLLRYRFLTASLMLVEQRSLAPLHAAFVVKNSTGVVLCGDSMAGKSTLAYACCREGWSYVTDDGVSLVRARPDRYAVGDYTTMRLREDSRRFFPELAERLAIVRPNGKIAMEISTPDLPIATLPGHRVDHVVFLDRQERGAGSLRPYSPDHALMKWEPYASIGPSEVRSAQKLCHRRLLEAGLWEMRYSSLDDGVARLERLAGS